MVVMGITVVMVALQVVHRLELSRLPPDKVTVIIMVVTGQPDRALKLVLNLLPLGKVVMAMVGQVDPTRRVHLPSDPMDIERNTVNRETDSASE